MNVPTAPPTPVSPPVLVGEIRRLGSLLDELARLLGRGLPPRLLALRGNVQLALERPESLDTAQNQLDFIEEFADAVWGEPLLSRTGRSTSAPPGGGRPPCPCELLESWEQLDRLSELLCQDAEAWHRRRTAGAREPLPVRRDSPA